MQLTNLEIKKRIEEKESEIVSLLSSLRNLKDETSRESIEERIQNLQGDLYNLIEMEEEI